MVFGLVVMFVWNCTFKKTVGIYLLLPIFILAPWCSGYHYCSTSVSKAWFQILRRFKPCSRHVGDLWWWESLTMVLAKNMGYASFVGQPFHKNNIIIISINYHITVSNQLYCTLKFAWLLWKSDVNLCRKNKFSTHFQWPFICFSRSMMTIFIIIIFSVLH